MTFKEQIEKYIDRLGEKIEKVIIGNPQFSQPLPKEYINTPKNWDDVSYLFDWAGDCFIPLYIFTKSYVVYVRDDAEYGSNQLSHLPRHPCDCEPEYVY